MKQTNIFNTICAIGIILLSANADATLLPLEGRLETAPGSGVYMGYYDPNLDITWSASANLNGRMDIDSVLAWIDDLTIGSVNDWRLPTVDSNGDGIVVTCMGGGVSGCDDNEVGFLFWEEGITASSPGPFSNVENFYWAEPETQFDGAWYFNFGGSSAGAQGIDEEGGRSYVWAVHDGDVSTAVPEPAVFWLIGSGLIGLLVKSKRRW
jgi:hypothetical protein